MKFFSIIGLVCLLVLGGVVFVSSTQAQSLCESIVQRAMTEFETNCADVGQGTFCYGYEGVDPRILTNPIEELEPPAPGSQVEIERLFSVQTTGLDTDLDEWGIASFKVETDLSDSDEPLIIIAMGDVRIENSVLMSNYTVSAITTAETAVLDAPQPDASVVYTRPAGTPIAVNAVTPDGAYVRLPAFPGTPWIATNTLEFEAGVLDTLPVIDPTPGSGTKPLRALSFETGGASDCSLAPNRFMIQTAAGSTVDMQVNSIPVRIGSTATFGTEFYQGQDVLYIYTVDGTVTLYPGSPSAVTIPTNTVTYAALDANNRVVPTAFVPPVPPSADGAGFLDLSYYATETLLPPTLVNYNVVVEGLTTELTCSGANETTCTITVQESASGSNVITPTTAAQITPTTAVEITPTVTVAEVGCSVDVGGEASVFFVNESTRSVDVVWIDRDCQEILYRTLEAGESYTQGTFVGHSWIIRATDTGETLRVFLPTEPGEAVVTIR